MFSFILLYANIQTLIKYGNHIFITLKPNYKFVNFKASFFNQIHLG